MKRRCLSCCRALPDWDTHKFCPRHRACTHLAPCVTCSAWAPTLWDRAEAWLAKHPIIQRAPALVPSTASRPEEEGLPPAARDLPIEVAVPTPAPPEETEEGSNEPSLDLHASGDSDMGDLSPARAWRPASVADPLGEQPVPGHKPVATQSRSPPSLRGLTVGTRDGGNPRSEQLMPGCQPAIPNSRSPPNLRGLTVGIEAGGEPQSAPHLPGHQQHATPSRSLPGPRGFTAEISGGGVPPAAQHRPGTQGAVLPGTPQAGAPGAWSSHLVQAAIQEAMDLPKKKKKKAKKRRAVDPPSELPSTGKKPKKKAKKLTGSKAKAKGDSSPSEAELFCMMKFMAAKHGWSMDNQQPPRGPAAVPSPYPSQPMPPPPTLPYSIPSTGPAAQAPAALGAPPGEETFPRSMRPPPLSTWEREESDTQYMVSSDSDFPSPSGSSATESDMFSVGSSAPSYVEPELPTAMSHLSEETEALLLRYLGEFYAVTPDQASSQPQGSRLFRTETSPSPGIPLTADFKAEYERIAQEPPLTPRAASLRRAFEFQPKDTEKYLAPEVLAPDVLALSDHSGRGGRGGRFVVKRTSPRTGVGHTWRRSPGPLCASPRMLGLLPTWQPRQQRDG